MRNMPHHLGHRAPDLSPEPLLNRALDFLFPIRRSELKKFCTITAMLFCILFVQNLAKALKDSLITTMVATEAISVLKTWGVLPAAILASLTYVKMTKYMKAEHIFYAVLSFFIAFFLTFAFVVFPNRIGIKPSYNNYSHLKLFALVFQHWDCSLLYIVSELWSNVVFALLFWQFVNSITSVSESKRTYILFGLLGQTGLYFSGQLLQSLPRAANALINRMGLHTTKALVCIQIVLSIMSLLGIVAIALFWLLNHVVVEKSLIEKFSFAPPKEKQGVLESLKLVYESKYIRLIGLLLFSYGLAANAIECLWREKIKGLYKATEANLAFTGTTMKYAGVLTVILVIVGAQIIRRLGWTVAAMIPPLCILASGMIFFGATNFEYISGLLACLFAVNPIAIPVAAGALQNVLARATKYTLFDSTKEMAYVPLDPEVKRQGKACADVVGTKLGKSLGALIQASIFILVPTANYDSISGFLMLLFAIACVTWIYAVLSLAKEYKAATSQDAT